MPKAPDSLKILKRPCPEITHFTMRKRLFEKNKNKKNKDIGHIYNLCHLLKAISEHTERPHSTMVRQMDSGAKVLVEDVPCHLPAE